MFLLIGLIFILLCKINVLYDDGSSSEVKNYPLAMLSIPIQTLVSRYDFF
jgi:hypothetical protein